MKLLENITCIKQGVKEVDPNHNIKITYIALCKKSNVKMFFYNGGSQEKYSNCPPGTIVDEHIVNDELSDFYMISQRTNQGVAQPVHYYIAFDDFGVDRNDLYTLIFKLSYLYFNWTGSIKIPGPCQYAKKLSQLMGEKLSENRIVQPPHNRFETQLKTLYFL
jgi:aubergine-like protein